MENIIDRAKAKGFVRLFIVVVTGRMGFVQAAVVAAAKEGYAVTLSETRQGGAVVPCPVCGKKIALGIWRARGGKTAFVCPACKEVWAKETKPATKPVTKPKAKPKTKPQGKAARVKAEAVVDDYGEIPPEPAELPEWTDDVPF
jgi:uncharacterized C2H2 Zn-finger protein